MEKYIKAIEKVIIADVVRYKDNLINKTKSVVHSPKTCLSFSCFVSPAEMPGFPFLKGFEIVWRIVSILRFLL